MENKKISDFEPISDDVLSILPVGLIKKNLAVPLKVADGRLLVAVPESKNVIKPEGLQLVAGCPVDFLTVSFDEVAQFISSHFPESKEGNKSEEVHKSFIEAVRESGEALKLEPDPEQKPDVPSLKEKSRPEPLESPHQENALMELTTPEDNKTGLTPPEDVHLPLEMGFDPHLFNLLTSALAERATEVLVDLYGAKVSVRYRIRGILLKPERQKHWDKKMAAELFSSVRKRGQSQGVKDVHWTNWENLFTIGEEEFCCSMSLTETHERTLLTIMLSPHQKSLYLPDTWGMDKEQGAVLGRLFMKNSGSILFCGPEKRGVEKIFYGCVRKCTTGDQHVISVEDQVDEWIPEADQFEAGQEWGNFQQLLGVAFHHQPDVLAVSPVERKDTFETCLRQSLKGPLVLVRSFAQDSADMLYQLDQMKVEPYLVGSGVLGIVVQQTLRLNCQACQKIDPGARELSRVLGIPSGMRPMNFYHGAGCELCGFTGFDHETNIFEVIEMTDDLRGFLHEGMKPDLIRQHLQKKNIRTLRQAAVHKALNGQTSLPEVIRVSHK